MRCRRAMPCHFATSGAKAALLAPPLAEPSPVSANNVGLLGRFLQCCGNAAHRKGSGAIDSERGDTSAGIRQSDGIPTRLRSQ